MSYPSLPKLRELCDQMAFYSQLKYEYGAKGISKPIKDAQRALQKAIADLKKLTIDEKLALKEPNKFADIKALRPDGPRKIWDKLDPKVYRDKLEGAFLGRLAACTLGAPVEFWSIKKMQEHAKYYGEQFPPVDYTREIPDPYHLRYNTTLRMNFTRDRMDGVPCDDDIMYTILGLLIVEECGLDFTVEDVARVWDKYVTVACTAEEVALNNFRKGVPAKKAADKDNPFCELIGAFIRADPWGYIAAGWPERAAAMAYKDAYLSHRRQGIYGEMFFAAAIAAAFTVDDPMEALRIGLTEIPAQCTLAKEISWALDAAESVKNYQDARLLVDQRYTHTYEGIFGGFYEEYVGMHPAHTINNAVLVVFGLAIGGCDFTKVISETVAMGMDNDCTAATAGSIVGAIVGKDGIPEYWYKPFNNKIHSYLKGKKTFSISGIINRFQKQAKEVYRS